MEADEPPDLGIGLGSDDADAAGLAFEGAAVLEVSRPWGGCGCGVCDWGFQLC